MKVTHRHGTRATLLVAATRAEHDGIATAMTRAIAAAQCGERAGDETEDVSWIFDRLDGFVQDVRAETDADIAIIATAVGERPPDVTTEVAPAPAVPPVATPADLHWVEPTGEPLELTLEAVRATRPFEGLDTSTPELVPVPAEELEERFWSVSDELPTWRDRLASPIRRARLFEIGAVVTLSLAILVRFG